MVGIANINSETGIPYGYISMRALDSDIVTELLDNGTDLDAQEAYNEWYRERIEQALESGECETREEAEDEIDSNEFWESYEPYEQTVEGEKDGVIYSSSWLGGALNFFIIQSPHVTDKATECSLCVPNAGNLDNLNGSYTCYDVPESWRRSEDY